MKIKKVGLSKRKRKTNKKVGLAPGTISYVGDIRDFNVSANVINYSESDESEVKHTSISNIKSDDPVEGVRWINIDGIHDVKVIEEIGHLFGLHNLVLEDIAHADQRPKLDEFDDYMYVVAQMITYDKENHQINSEQLSIILKNKTLISFQEQPGDLFNGVRERIRTNSGRLRKSGADYLLYALLDTIVDNYFVVLEQLGDDLDQIEVRLLDETQNQEINELHSIKRELILLRKSVWPTREVIGSLSKSLIIQQNRTTELYLRDAYDHCIRAIDTLETYREMSSSLLDMYLSSMSNKMNTVMKTLTIISTIFIPLTFIVGIYGMNFKYMPELEMPYSYGFVWVIMIVLTLIMVRYFRKKGWF
ncbi:MAG: magnesium/cobalt transporter CorA [Bacteroidia bacterium]